MRRKANTDIDEQIDAIVSWARNYLTTGEIVFVDFERRQETFIQALTSIPTWQKARRQSKKPKDRDVRLRIHSPYAFPHKTDEWTCLFRNANLEVLESTRFDHKHLRRRWRLPKEEKRALLSVARQGLEFFLTHQMIPNVAPRKNLTLFNIKQLRSESVPPQFLHKADVNVALWCDGVLRGSAIITNKHLMEGVVLAAIDAARDQRFKPLEKRELDITRIEMSIMSDLWVPLTQGEIRDNLIYPEKGYVVKYKGKTGWFLPEVFNVKKFRDLNHLLTTLYRDKTGITDFVNAHKNTWLFEVDNFIESSDHLKGHTLIGSVVSQIERQDTETNRGFVLKQSLQKSAEQLCLLQEPDGYIANITDPFSQKNPKNLDWARTIFSLYALAEFGRATNNSRYSDCAKEGLYFVLNYLNEKKSHQRNTMGQGITPAIYTGLLAHSLEEKAVAKKAARMLINEFAHVSRFNPITYGQLMSFLQTQPQKGTTESVIDYVAKILRLQFKSSIDQGHSMSYAVWAEAANAFRFYDPAFAEEVFTFLKGGQTPYGAFRDKTDSSFVYTRGTAKIIEVLSLDYEKNKSAIEHALLWLYSMQYNTENSYFMREEIRRKAIGGFRHDYLNTEVWADATGHFLLTGARLLERGPYKAYA